MIHPEEKFLSIYKPVRIDKLYTSKIQGGISIGQTSHSKTENWKEKWGHGP